MGDIQEEYLIALGVVSEQSKYIFPRGFQPCYTIEVSCVASGCDKSINSLISKSMNPEEEQCWVSIKSFPAWCQGRGQPQMSRGSKSMPFAQNLCLTVPFLERVPNPTLFPLFSHLPSESNSFPNHLFFFTLSLLLSKLQCIKPQNQD